MVDKIYNRAIFLLMQSFSTATLIFCALTSIAFAQENLEQDTFADTSATTTSTSTDPQVQSTEPPYPTEPLLGDAVYGDFVVGPGKIEVEIEPGQTKTVQMTVANRTGGPKTFRISYEDATGSSDPTRTVVLLGDDRGPYSMKDYVSVPHQSFVLEHNQRARIPVTITLPQDAEPGGLYGSVLVETLASGAADGEEQKTVPKSAVVARIGALFFITIPGATAYEGLVTQFETIGGKKFFQEGPINFGILFQNTGSVHLTPHGEVRVTNMFNEEVGFVELEPWFVLPNATRLREFSWSRELLFGKYTATASVDPGHGIPVQTLSYTFWVLPWKPLAGICTGLFVIIFIIRAFFRNFEFKRKS